MMIQIEQHRIYDTQTFRFLLQDLVEHLPVLTRAMKSGSVDSRFRERIMLAVTSVNECRYCSYYHTKVSLEAGISADEIREMLNGELGEAPPEEAPALAFAQHYAETKGRPDRGVWERIVEVYGLEKAEDIIAVVRVIMLGNVYGNNFDFLLRRLSFRPFPGSTFGREFYILFGSIVILPWILIRKRVTDIRGRKA